MDKAVKLYTEKQKAAAEIELKAAKEFRKLNKVIKSCVTIEQLDNARNMCDLYEKKWRNVMGVTTVIRILLSEQRNKIRGGN